MCQVLSTWLYHSALSEDLTCSFPSEELPLNVANCVFILSAKQMRWFLTHFIKDSYFPIEHRKEQDSQTTTQVLGISKLGS